MLQRPRTWYDIENAYRKAEYVSEVNIDKGIGCGECVKRCQFGAISLGKDKHTRAWIPNYASDVDFAGWPVNKTPSSLQIGILILYLEKSGRGSKNGQIRMQPSKMLSTS